MSGGSPVDNFVDAIVDPVKDAGSWIDDKINEEIPGGWITVAALAGGAYLGAEAIAAGNAAESAALASGATASEAAAAGAAAAEAASATNYLGTAALGGAETGAVGTGATGFGLSAGSAAGGAAGGTGISTASLAGTPLGVGMNTLGTGASSGLGYLGGTEALASGTAGMTGVTAPSSISIGDAVRGLRTASGLLGGQQQQPQPFGINQQVAPRGMVDYTPILTLLERRASTPNVSSLLG